LARTSFTGATTPSPTFRPSSSLTSACWLGHPAVSFANASAQFCTCSRWGRSATSSRPPCTTPVNCRRAQMASDRVQPAGPYDPGFWHLRDQRLRSRRRTDQRVSEPQDPRRTLRRLSVESPMTSRNRVRDHAFSFADLCEEQCAGLTGQGRLPPTYPIPRPRSSRGRGGLSGVRFTNEFPIPNLPGLASMAARH
jgi:hypothetical protein